MLLENEDPQMNAKHEKGFFRRWYDRYDFLDGWYERINTGQEWLQYLLTLLKTKAATTAAAATVASGAAVGTIAVVKPELLQGWLLPAAEVEVSVKRWGEAVVFPVKGRDAAGRGAEFFVIVLPKTYTWARGSESRITREGETMTEADIQSRIFSPEMRAGLAAAEDIIAVGAASQEGSLAAESLRAGQRGLSAAKWLAGLGNAKAALWTLNLGQFRNACAAKDSADTSWQRPVIFVSVAKKDEAVNLAQAFADAISGKSNLPSRECYSNFDLKRYP